MAVPLPTPTSEQRRMIMAAGILSLVGASLGMVADTLQLYNPNGGYLEGNYGFLRTITHERLMWGHYLGILAIPLEAAGLWLVYLALRPLGRRVALGMALLGVYMIFPGIAYHASVYPMGEVARAGVGASVGTTAAEWIERLRPFNEPLGVAFALAFLGLMVPLTYWIARGRTLLPRWAALSSPLVTYLVCFLLLMAVPPVGNLLMPMGFNLSMGIFVAVVWVYLRKVAA